MRKTKSKKNESLTYKDKTNFVTGSSSDIFYTNFFTYDDAEKIKNLIFKDELLGELDNFHKLLNNVVSFSAVFKSTKLKPGKTDKRELVEKICQLAGELGDHIEILMHQYGYETIKHIPIIVLGEKGWQQADTYKFFSTMAADLANVKYIRDVATRKINEDSGKKTGNNSKNSIPNLIYHLIKVYELVTNKKANENFKQDAVGGSPYKGQFYEFLYCVFEIINENYNVRYPGTTEPNPFKIDFKTEDGEESHSLGKYIQKVFRLSVSQPK